MRVRLLPLLAVLATAGPTLAQAGVVTQWTFNGTSGTTTPSTGVGTAVAVGGTMLNYFSGTAAGGSTDTTASATNFGLSLNTFPAAAVNPGTAGARFNASTAGRSDILFRFDLRLSNTASRYFQMEYTTDGTTFTAAGAVDANLGSPPTDTWYNNRTFDLSGVAAAAGAAGFGVRVVSVFPPAGTAYQAYANGSSYTTAGTAWFDAVTVAQGSRWVGGSGPGLSTVANYAGGTAPPLLGGVALFGPAGGANTSVVVPVGGVNLDQVVFQTSAPAYTVSGTSVLAVAAGLVNNSSAVQTVSAPVAFGNQTSVLNAGTLTLSGATSTYVGGLQLQGAGRINLNGNLNANVAGQQVYVAPTATLGGTGTLGATTATRVQVFSGGMLSPGAVVGTPGTLTAGGGTAGTAATNAAVRFEAGSVFRLAVTAAAPVADLAANAGQSATPGTGNSLLATRNAAGGTSVSLSFASGAAGLGTNVTTDMVGVTLNPANQYSFLVATGANILPVGPNVTVQGGTFTFTNGVSDITASITAQFTPALQITGGSNVYLTLVPVPESATVLAVAAAGLGTVRLRRRLTVSSRRPG